MNKQHSGKIFMHGRSQAVRLPKEFRLPGKEVQVSRFGDGVLLRPLRSADWSSVFTHLDTIGDDGTFDRAEWRDQPAMPTAFDLDKQ